MCIYFDQRRQKKIEEFNGLNLKQCLKRIIIQQKKCLKQPLIRPCATMPTAFFMNKNVIQRIFNPFFSFFDQFKPFFAEKINFSRENMFNEIPNCFRKHNETEWCKALSFDNGLFAEMNLFRRSFINKRSELPFIDKG